MREGGQYVDPGGNAYEMQQQQQQQRMSDHRIENEKSSYGPPLKGEGQWGWARDGSSHMFNQGGQGSYYQSQGQTQRSDQRLIASENEGNDLRSQPREEDMEIGYEDNFAGPTFESLEQRFYDDIFKLTKEQNDAEDAENTRHRERINAIGAQYEQQLGALRARHANQRDEFLRRESHARQQQYQQALEQQHHYANSPGFSHPHHHGYNVDSYRDRPRFTRDPGFDPRGGRGFGTASRYY